MEIKHVDRRIAVLLIAGICAVLFMYGAYGSVPEVEQLIIRALPSMPRDMDGYLAVFFSAFLFLGLVPTIATRVLGFNLREIGMAMPVGQRPALLLLGLALSGAIVGGIGAQFAPLKNFYPLSRRLIDFASEYGSWTTIVHIAAYVCLFYLPWELFFRGILILPLIGTNQNSGSPPASSYMVIAGMQALPSALLHIGHPLTETIGSVFFGLAAAYFVVRTKSVFPSLCFHAAVGVALDVVIIAQAAG